MSKVYLFDKKPVSSPGESTSPYQAPALRLTVITPEGFVCSSIFGNDAIIEGHEKGVVVDMSDYADQTEWFIPNPNE